MCEPPALAGAVATGSTLASEDRICGRKKLPFAGYSVVKDPKTLRRRVVRRSCRPELLILRSRAAGRKQKRKTVNPFARVRERSGEYRARTGDLLVANQALSQLS